MRCEPTRFFVAGLSTDRRARPRSPIYTAPATLRPDESYPERFAMRPSSSRSAAVLFLAGVACTDALPTQPAIDVRSASFTLSDETANAVREAINDARERIVPTLGGARETLAPSLVELAAAIRTRDRALLRRAIANADDVLTSLGGDSDSIGNEVDAVRLVLEQVRSLTNQDAPTNPR